MGGAAVLELSGLRRGGRGRVKRRVGARLGVGGRRFFFFFGGGAVGAVSFLLLGTPRWFFVVAGLEVVVFVVVVCLSLELVCWWPLL